MKSITYDQIYPSMKQKAKCWRDFKLVVNSLMAGWFHFSAACKGKAPVDFSELSRSGVAESQNALGIKENNSGYAELAFAPLRTEFFLYASGLCSCKEWAAFIWILREKEDLLSEEIS